jgi:hypothetical protein
LVMPLDYRLQIANPVAAFQAGRQKVQDRAVQQRMQQLGIKQQEQALEQQALDLSTDKAKRGMGEAYEIMSEATAGGGFDPVVFEGAVRRRAQQYAEEGDQDAADALFGISRNPEQGANQLNALIQRGQAEGSLALPRAQAVPVKLKPETITDAEGNSRLANYNPQTGQYSDPNTGEVIQVGAPAEDIGDTSWQTKEVIMDGKPSLIQIHPKTGEIRRLEGVSPPAKSGERLTVGSDGQVVHERGVGLTSGAQTDIQKKLTGIDLAISNIKEIKETFDPKEESITTMRTNVEQAFNTYRKEITGAAASVKELDRLKKSMFNMDMSPTEFTAAISQFENLMVRSRDLYNNLLSQGVSPGDAGKEVDSNLDKWKTDVTADDAIPEGWTLMTDANGNQAYVSPDGSDFREIN